jgi:hypothetical protein
MPLITTDGMRMPWSMESSKDMALVVPPLTLISPAPERACRVQGCSGQGSSAELRSQQLAGAHLRSLQHDASGLAMPVSPQHMALVESVVAGPGVPVTLVGTSLRRNFHAFHSDRAMQSADTCDLPYINAWHSLLRVDPLS